MLVRSGTRPWSSEAWLHEAMVARLTHGAGAVRQTVMAASGAVLVRTEQQRRCTAPDRRQLPRSRSSLGDGEDQGAEVPNAGRSSRRRARCVPDRPVNAGNLRPFAGSFACLMTCAHIGPSIAAYVLLSSHWVLAA